MTSKQEASVYINRDISWLYFNQRVLQEAMDKGTPLIERIKFLGIFSNNLDEFFRVRVAVLNRLVTLGGGKTEYDGFSPKKILKEINSIVLQQQKNFVATYNEILTELAKQKIFIKDEKQLSISQGKFVRKYFNEKVLPNLFPIMIRNLNKDAALKDKSIYLAVILKNKRKKKAKQEYALIKVPTDIISRFFILPKTSDSTNIILLEDVIRYCLDDVFSIMGFTAGPAYIIKFTRDAELDFDNDISKSFMETISESLKQRITGQPVRFIYDKTIPENLLKVLMKIFNVTNKDNLVPGGKYHNFKDFINFPKIGNSNLLYKHIEPIYNKLLSEKTSIFKILKKTDILLHFPYQPFDHILNILREASMDPKVLSIRITLYRLAKESNIINALINAARNGKSVTVCLELQARFDEQANIRWSQKLFEEGVKVIHGMPGLKVHAKLILIKRIEGNNKVLYTSLGTGNFNEDTASIYADTHLLTTNPLITEEADKIFKLLESNFAFPQFKTLVVSPYNMRDHFIRCINKEISNSRKGKDAWIILKLNSLVDPVISQKLLKASIAGVKIKMIIRGSCLLKSGVSGISDNIEIISIVDRYLEHSRVIVFANDGDPLVYLTSADWMIRNFDYRIEIACPVLDKNLQQELIDILNLQLKDNVKSRVLSIENYNSYKKAQTGHSRYRSQMETFKYFNQIQK
jgi:polyphosphate kinase